MNGSTFLLYVSHNVSHIVESTYNYMINTTYLTAIIILIICGGWAISAKAYSRNNGDYIPIFETPLYSITTAITFLVFIISLILNWINIGFLSTLCYIGICIGCGFVNGLVISPILNRLFGYSGIGAILPIIACIASSIYLFIAQFS